MSWGFIFRVRQYLKQSLWFLPLVGAMLGPVVALVDQWLEQYVTVPVSLQYSASTATTLLTTIVAAMVSLIGFVVTVSVLVIQLSTGTFSARYMRIWYRDHLLKAVLAVLAGTLTFSFTLLRRVASVPVPSLGVTVASILVVVGLVLFLFFLDRFVHRLRPVAVAALMAGAARDVILSTPSPVGEPEDRVAAPSPDGDPPVGDGDPAFVVHSRRAGSVQAVDRRGLVTWGRQHDCRLVFSAAIGDFMPAGAALVAVVGNAHGSISSERRLRRMIAFGPERTIEQDPGFAMRIMVDVAIRALSAAINDPTTAVQVLDHLEELLRRIGSTELHGRAEFRDEHGTVRLVMPARRWEDYLTLAVTEIREYGARAMQVMRRLRAMLERLQESVRPEYRAAVEEELRRLNRSVATRFADSVDLDRASTPDRQGIGGPSRDATYPPRR